MSLSGIHLLPIIYRQICRMHPLMKSIQPYHQQLKVKLEPSIYRSPHRYLCSNDQSVYCNQCDAKLSASILCDKCGAITDIDNQQNYFQLLQVPVSYDLDPKLMSTNFKRIQSTVHPDKFGNKSSEEQEKSAEWSALLNKAYATLSHPVKRGEYLLQLEGLKIPETNESIHPEFLVEIMEKNEQVQNLKKKDEIEAYLAELQTDLQTFFESLGTEFNKKNHLGAVVILTKIRYYTSIEQRLKEKLYEM